MYFFFFTLRGNSNNGQTLFFKFEKIAGLSVFSLNAIKYNQTAIITSQNVTPKPTPSVPNSTSMWKTDWKINTLHYLYQKKVKFILKAMNVRPVLFPTKSKRLLLYS